MSLKVITIDFWNTLFNSANGEERTYERERIVAEEIAKLGHELPKEVLKDGFHEAWNFFNEEWLNNQRTPTTKELVQHFWAHLQLVENDDTARLLEKAFAEGILDYPPELMPGVAEALKTLSQKYKLALISDTAFSPGSILKELMESEGIAKYFSAYSFSDETGVAKPHEFAYIKVLQELDCEPENALHIGDIEKTDILGAKSLGMKAILFKGDKESPMNIHAEESTQADFTAESWEEIGKLVSKM
ncbi:MAG TPA: HAD family hydrolase [Patescibacteria group bacterium]|nr:HAD family hydrolase [Patescibacteria group bacterium]